MNWFASVPGFLGTTAAVFALMTGVPAAANAAEVDFSGKRITVIVPFSEGGGTDGYSRLMAPYFEKYLPGNPQVMIVNRPGGGGLTGVNYYEATADEDGLTVLALSTSALSNYMLGDKRARFEMQDFVPIILSPRGIVQYVRSDLGIQNESTLKDRIEKLASYSQEELVFGGKTPTSGGLALRTALSLLGIEVKSVFGLGGNGPMALAFERGEFNLNYDNTLSFLNNRSHMIRSGLAVPLYTFGVLNEDGSISRDPALPDVPTFNEAYEAYHGKKPSGEGYEAWKSLMAVSVPLSKSWNLKAGTPPEIIEAWREAAKKVYAEVSKDPRGRKVFGPYRNIIGESAVAIMNEGTTLKPQAGQWLASYVKDHFNMAIAARTD
ncbi:MAG: Bug family tripartite tricarboxylate transporter substrate binding protein [Betaproteobacteria bacterium]